MSRTSSTNAERGITLIESALYLVIALSVFLGGTYMFREVRLNQRVGDTARMIQNSQMQIRSMFPQQNEFDGKYLDRLLIEAEAIPEDFVHVGNYDQERTNVDARNPDSRVIRHPWGGLVHITGSFGEIGYEFQELPPAPCIRGLTTNANGDNAFVTNMNRLWVNDYYVEADDFPITPSDATEFCHKKRNRLEFTTWKSPSREGWPG